MALLFFDSSIVVENTAGLKTPVRTKLASGLNYYYCYYYCFIIIFFVFRHDVTIIIIIIIACYL